MKKLTLISFILFLLNFSLTSAASFENSCDYKLLYETIATVNENGESEISIPENLTTWIFEDGTVMFQMALSPIDEC